MSAPRALACWSAVTRPLSRPLPAPTGIPAAAMLRPAWFALSSAGCDATKPSRFIVLLDARAASLALGVVARGAGLLAA
jgi:hypothetical protein